MAFFYECMSSCARKLLDWQALAGPEETWQKGPQLCARDLHTVDATHQG